MKMWTLILIIMMLLSACSGNNSEKKMLKQAVIVHNEMMRDAASLEELLNSMVGDTTLGIPADSLVAWTAALNAWKKDVVEVPGNEEHHHEEGHHHHHHKTDDVTADQMLMIQQDLNSKLLTLQQRVRTYTNKL